jgi:hypothetical protein
VIVIAQRQDGLELLFVAANNDDDAGTSASRTPSPQHHLLTNRDLRLKLD